MLNGCLGMPETVKPVDNFELNRYLGTWYEIARLDHSFEAGLERVSAEYNRLPKGGISVKNRGYDPESDEWVEATGQAFFVNQDDQGYLQVSFFGPFYSSYVIFELDKEGYQHAFVSGPNYDYLWLLSRTPDVSDELKNKFRLQARTLGFDVDELIFVEQEL
ncbi:outer membrane lipoprotein blc precursor [Vibrio ichthyoenteri ATCC 700023]|uniref:Outer membrane lipoprotein Blc n=2 Tax=Vibrio ichthyoenteri TaxID=142461 RepID=F9RXN4_9VIBR|nr:outer membrane lipoprotein blc precursor [Vibrio ichthyoenteri ATCC 700023]